MGRKKNPAAVALGKLSASKRTPEQLAEAGRRGGLTKADNRRRTADLADVVHDHFERMGNAAALAETSDQPENANGGSSKKRGKA